MDIITEEQIEAARVAHAELVQARELQLMNQRKAEREAKENATHTLELERTKGGSYSGAYTVPGFRIHVTASNGYSAEDRKKARVYVSGADDVDFAEAYEATRRDTEAKGSSAIRGDNPATDKMFDRLNRQVVKNERAVLDAALSASADLRELVGDAALHFSRKAGCSCGCSAGFVASHHIAVQHDGRTLNVTDVFVTREVTR